MMRSEEAPSCSLWVCEPSARAQASAWTDPAAQTSRAGGGRNETQHNDSDRGFNIKRHKSNETETVKKSSPAN